MPWTHFFDMSSGGREKEVWKHIYVELPEPEARRWFFNRFGHSADRVTCTCCGEDYSVTESEDLLQATGYERGLRFATSKKDPDRYLEPGEEVPEGYDLHRDSRALGQTMEIFRTRDDVLIVSRSEVDPSELEGDVPQQGYVWVD
jgi:hypothetical protein